MEHGLKHRTFYVQKYIAPLEMCYNPPVVRDKPLGAPAFVRPVYFDDIKSISKLLTGMHARICMFFGNEYGNVRDCAGDSHLCRMFISLPIQ